MRVGSLGASVRRVSPAVTGPTERDEVFEGVGICGLLEVLIGDDVMHVESANLLLAVLGVGDTTVLTAVLIATERVLTGRVPRTAVSVIWLPVAGPTPGRFQPSRALRFDVEYEHTGEGWRETGREPVTQLDLLSSSNWPSGFIGPSFAFGERR